MDRGREDSKIDPTSQVEVVARPPCPVAVWLLVGVGLMGSACRSHRGFRQDYVQKLRPVLVKGEWDVAAANIARLKGRLYKEEDRVMFWLNHGTALHYAGNYEASSKAFFQAEETMQELWTESISEEVGKVLVTETVQTYSGEDYERILTYLYTSINAASEGRLQDAVVEARRADGFLQKLRIEYEKEGGLGTVYTQDAFALWLIGLWYELEGSYADAYLAYKASSEAYETLYQGTFSLTAPDYLVEDLFRAASLAGLTDEATRWQTAGADGASLEAFRTQFAEIILFHGNGEAPYKVEKTFTAAAPDGYLVRVATPELRNSPRATSGSYLVVGSQQEPSVVVQPVESIANAQFKQRIGGIRARAIARAIAKYVAVKAASEAAKKSDKENGKLVGNLITLFGGLASAASEGADLRSWTLLPAEFRVARLWVEPGTHEVQVKLVGSNQTSKIAYVQELTLAAGERRLISMRSIL